MNQKEKIQSIWNGLKKMYPDAECTLETDENPFYLFVRGILSAQCTDKRVNEVSRLLFEKYPDIQAFAAADESEIAQQIRSCGLYRSKAKGIVGSAQILLEKYNGEIPKSQEILETFPSVGRKIANLIVGEIYGIPAIVVDTHCGRVAFRLGLTRSHTPAKVEKDLMKLFPSENWILLGHLMVAHGRKFCKAKNPDCIDCLIRETCDYGQKTAAAQ